MLRAGWDGHRMMEGKELSVSLQRRSRAAGEYG